MKTLIKVCKIFMYLVGGFFVVMAFDCLGGSDPFFNRIGCFLISSLPGIALIIVTILLRKKEFLLGIVIYAAAVFFFIFFRFYEEIGNKWPVISVVIVPLIFTGTVFVISRNKYDK